MKLVLNPPKPWPNNKAVGYGHGAMVEMWCRDSTGWFLPRKENTKFVLYSDPGQRVLYAFFTRFFKRVFFFTLFTPLFIYPLCAFFTPIRHHVVYRVFNAFFVTRFFLS